MYLISQIFKKSKPVGDYYCNVFYVNYWNFSDITKYVAERFWFDIENHSIRIPHWAGTWYQTIKEALTLDEDWNIKNHIIVSDVSVLNQ